MALSPEAGVIHGRARELAVVDSLVSAARSGRGGVLVLRGEAGIGKSVLLERAAPAGDAVVLRGSGVETESELPFAGLHQLIGRYGDRFGALPAHQAEALRGALGLGPSGQGDRFLVGLAVLTLLSDLADERPVICLVDDAHWLDRASAEALLFAARRLEVEPVVMIFGVRDPHAPVFPTHGLPELELTGIGGAAAADLLAEHATDLPHHVRARVLREAQGNPLALIELAAARRDGRAAQAGLGAPGVHGRVQQSFAAQIAGLPERTQTVVLVAAAEETGEVSIVLGAAAGLGAGVDDLQLAEQADLLRHVDGRLEFRHPLIRAAAYQQAALGRRIAVHRALADTLGEVAGASVADRRAWHLAASSTGPDESIAAALELSAERARAVGGFAAVAAAYERAASLSADPGRRSRRLLAAATAATDAGMLEKGAALAAEAAATLDDPVDRAAAAGIGATLADEQLHVAASHRMLVDAAVSVAAVAPDRADYLLMRSMDTALLTADLALIAESAKLAADDGVAKGYAAAVLGLGAETAGEIAAGVAALRGLVNRVDLLRLRESPIAHWWHELLGDDEAAIAIAERVVQDCRDRGAAGVLPLALTVLARSQRHRGQHHLALASVREGLRIAADTGQAMSVVLLHNINADLAAVRGDESACRDALAGMEPSRPLDAILSACSLTLLDVGLGHYEPIMNRRDTIVAGANRTYTLFTIPDVVEAAARLGRHREADDAHAFFTAWAEHSGQPWACAVALRCAALLTGGVEAERAYRQALDLHRRGGRPFEQARTELVYGEWLRRARRRGDARPVLSSAAETFERLGAQVWLDRARSELRAAGQFLGEREGVVPKTGRLTPQELQVVRLAAQGLSNRDIGTQLFLSPRTIGYHLSNAYPKLQVTSRADLRTMTFE
ncbi:helix-turn-helix transcriptional regulator [Pseudonocardia sp. TRM90224]|uniref:helix-turn-helix transcriptional regulator n=1 Tax=Pseudonocardia sp. TRM90224 TaxID=2812678 RepID=UPI001E5E313C|nr:LuxR family transcriptional regulator [Pseudonocardia sp. TRM90224]